MDNLDKKKYQQYIYLETLDPCVISDKELERSNEDFVDIDIYFH